MPVPASLSQSNERNSIETCPTITPAQCTHIPRRSSLQVPVSYGTCHTSRTNAATNDGNRLIFLDPPLHAIRIHGRRHRPLHSSMIDGVLVVAIFPFKYLRLKHWPGDSVDFLVALDGDRPIRKFSSRVRDEEEHGFRCCLCACEVTSCWALVEHDVHKTLVQIRCVVEVCGGCGEVLLLLFGEKALSEFESSARHVLLLLS